MSRAALWGSKGVKSPVNLQVNGWERNMANGWRFRVEMPGGRLSVRIATLLLIVAFTSQFVGFPNAGVTALSASSNAFVVRYCTHDNYTWDPPYSNDRYLFIYSNGTATYQFIEHNQWGNSTTTWTSQLSATLVSKMYNTLIDEGFMSLSNSYNDLGLFQMWLNHTERACIEISGEFKTVTFNGHSMMGIAPGSYALLNNIRNLVAQGLSDLPNATLGIMVNEPSDGGPVASITANFTNNGETTLWDTGLCNVSWPTFVVSVNGSTVGDLQNGTYLNCSMEFNPHTTTHFGPWKWNRTGLSPGKYVIMSKVVIWNYVIGNISSDSTWTSIGNHAEPKSHNEGFYLVLIGLSTAIAASVAAFSVIHIRRKRP